jgi:hypothetical protein
MSIESYEHGPEEKNWAAYFEALAHSQYFPAPLTRRNIVGEANLQFAVMQETCNAFYVIGCHPVPRAGAKCPKGWRG